MTHDREQLLELYLDGMLDASQRASFERELADDPVLRAAVGRQAQVDASLGRAFEVPAFDAARFAFADDSSGNGQGKSPATSPATPREAEPAVAPLPLRAAWSWPAKYAAIAAVVLISFALVAWLVRDRNAPTEYPEMAWRSVEMVYR